jgi:hypothetical protein
LLKISSDNKASVKGQKETIQTHNTLEEKIKEWHSDTQYFRRENQRMAFRTSDNRRLYNCAITREKSKYGQITIVQLVNLNLHSDRA